MPKTLNRETVRAAKADIEIFARDLVGAPLFDYQLDAARNPSDITVLNAGRQVGKSTLMAMCALHRAFAQPGSMVLILSAGESAAKTMLSRVAELMRGTILEASTVEDLKDRIVLTTGSTIRCLPASERAVRGESVDLLILDEAAKQPADMWSAAAWTTVARPGSRVIMASTPWSQNHWFHRAYIAGQAKRDGYYSYHWPSTTSPLMNTERLEQLRATMTTHQYNAEVLAEWSEDVGAYFSTAELDACVADYTLTPPDKAYGQLAVAGLDWGRVHDAQAVTLLAALDDQELNKATHPEETIYYIPWLENHFNMRYSDFQQRILDIAKGYELRHIVSELNGPGNPATEQLSDLLRRNRHVTKGQSWIAGVNTTNRGKQNAFGMLKLLVQSGRIVLPREPDLLSQLHSLTYERTDSGQMRIAVPDIAGHDDAAMSLAQCMSTIGNNTLYREDNPRPRKDTILTTPGGTRIHQTPRALNNWYAFGRARVHDRYNKW